MNLVIVLEKNIYFVLKAIMISSWSEYLCYRYDYIQSHCYMQLLHYSLSCSVFLLIMETAQVIIRKDICFPIKSLYIAFIVVMLLMSLIIFWYGSSISDHIYMCNWAVYSVIAVSSLKKFPVQSLFASNLSQL